MEQGVLNHILLLLEWNAASEHNYAACWALMVELAFFGGRKRPPFAAEWAASLFLLSLWCHSETTQEEEKKAVFRGFLPSLEKKLSCRHQGKGPRLYTAAEAESGWKVRIAWLADWLEGKDSMIDWLRVLWIMGHSYLGRDRWRSFGQAEAIWA